MPFFFTEDVEACQKLERIFFVYRKPEPLMQALELLRKDYDNCTARNIIDRAMGWAGDWEETSDITLRDYVMRRLKDEVYRRVCGGH